MALVVSGQVRHRHMQPEQVHTALSKRLPGLLVSAPDFSIERTDCRVQFFCNTSSTLDFTVELKASGKPAPAAVAVLVRETEILTDALVDALGRRFRKAQVKYCLLEDEHSRSRLLSWISDAPLTSRPARFSYLLCIGLLILAAVLVKGQLHQAASDSRNFNIISLLLAICLPALTLPLPFIFEHMQSRGTGRWTFSQNGGG
jgi:hypothetical protein